MSNVEMYENCFPGDYDVEFLNIEAEWYITPRSQEFVDEAKFALFEYIELLEQSLCSKDATIKSKSLYKKWLGLAFSGHILGKKVDGNWDFWAASVDPTEPWLDSELFDQISR